MVDKKRQLELIINNNPFNAELGNHTWIKNVSDIKTYDEVWKEEGEVYGITPDFSKEDAENAFRTGKIVVYSSYPIRNGTFVTPSKMEAMSYSGNGKVYRKLVNLEDVAWIDPTQGQYASVRENIKPIRLSKQDLHEIVKETLLLLISEN